MIGDFITSVCTVVVFIIIIAFCCLSDSNDSKKSTPKRNVPKQHTVRTSSQDDSYCICPSCGAAYYDGYCEECGYPDINQGWIGENY